MEKYSYALMVGSNRRHVRYGQPRHVVEATGSALSVAGLEIVSSSKIIATPALGPGGRSYGNGAFLIVSDWPPPVLLKRIKAIERMFGRRRGRRWGPRVLDIDIILWSKGAWRGRRLTIPHSSFRERLFVLDPLAEIIPLWRDPGTGHTIRQLRARLRKRKPVDPNSPRA